MSATATPPATDLMTADEFYEFGLRPENRNRNFELVRGKAVEMSHPRRNHGVICSNINSFFDRFARDNKFGYVTTPTGVLTEQDPDTVRGPDVCYWNDIEKPEDLPERWGTTVPLVAVEVLSPNDRKQMIAEKLSEYLRSGVGEVWIVDPEECFVAIHQVGQPPAVYREDTTLKSSLLPGFTCAVASLFQFPNGQPLPKDE
jgi:Uma2 family endonuclease